MIAIAAAVGLLALVSAASAAARPGARAVALANAGALVAAALACGAPALRTLVSGEAVDLSFAWSVPGGALALGLDPLSAFFLLPVVALAALAGCYGVGYLDAEPSPQRRMWPAFSALTAAMIAVLVARNAVLFLTAWEVMTLAAWALISCGAPSAESARAGWIYLVASHVGSAALLLLFALLMQASGERTDFAALRGAASGLPTAGLLLLGLLGFGVKAGVLPLHVWLPEAHAAAPSHVSALMSGALVKLGLYGMLRLLWLLEPVPAQAGLLLAALGLAGALFGVGLALQQRDVKRALAYSSIENLGLIAFGVGLARWGQASGAPLLAHFALVGALLHVWNHAAMKGLMFLGAGAVVHGAGTRDLERLGGLLARMPRTGACMVVGAVALAGLPPLNGVAGEWLLLRGLLEAWLGLAGAASAAAVLGAALLALVGGLAAAVFVRLIGVALLGQPRSSGAAAAHEVSPWMGAPLALLALSCAALGVWPAGVLALLGPLVEQLGGAAGDVPLAPAADALATLGALAAQLWVALALGALVAWLARRRPVARGETWGCGYAAPTPRMQYTARSFSEQLARRLIPAVFAPRLRLSGPLGLFPLPGQLVSEDADPLLRASYEPLFGAVARRLVRLRVLQFGRANLYLTYMLAALLASLLWISLRGWWPA